jgi:hypothetical protein
MTTDHIGEMRKAVAEGDWQSVLRLWEAYSGGLLEEIGHRTCSAARMAEARDFLEWAQRIVLCSRAQAQAYLDRIHAAQKYAAQPLPPRPSLQTSL